LGHQPVAGFQRRLEPRARVGLVQVKLVHLWPRV
jgi:hypothetical protein